jgi:hypothetical protein
MATPPSNQSPFSFRAAWVKPLAVKIVALVLLGVSFGFIYDWAGPRFYGAGTVPGFRLGVLHGALMPVALPTLLMGKDVPIYATAPTGRPYKIGYIAGINLCGMIFFGVAFWRSPKAQKEQGAKPFG